MLIGMGWLNKLRFRPDDPLRQLHVPARKREDVDTDPLPTNEDIDLQWYRDHPDGAEDDEGQDGL